MGRQRLGRRDSGATVDVTLLPASGQRARHSANPQRGARSGEAGYHRTSRGDQMRRRGTLLVQSAQAWHTGQFCEPGCSSRRRQNARLPGAGAPSSRPSPRRCCSSACPAPGRRTAGSSHPRTSFSRDRLQRARPVDNDPRTVRAHCGVGSNRHPHRNRNGHRSTAVLIAHSPAAQAYRGTLTRSATSPDSDDPTIAEVLT